MVTEAKTAHDLFKTSHELGVAWERTKRKQTTLNTSEQVHKNYENACELYGAFYAVAYLLGTVSDNDWQKFLARV